MDFELRVARKEAASATATMRMAEKAAADALTQAKEAFVRAEKAEAASVEARSLAKELQGTEKRLIVLKSRKRLLDQMASEPPKGKAKRRALQDLAEFEAKLVDIAKSYDGKKL